MRQGYLGHLSDMPHQVVYAMREDSGEHREQGEENSRPVGDVDEKEVVDMNTPWVARISSKRNIKASTQNDSTGLYLIDVGEILARLLARTSTYPNTEVTPTDANRKK